MELGRKPKYNEDDFTAFIPFAREHDCFTKELRLNIHVPKYHEHHGSKPFYYHEAVMDTGSTGLLISAFELGYTDEGQLKDFEKGTEYLSSSCRYYEGYWLPTRITFPDGDISAEVKILAVTLSGICSKFNDASGTCDELIEETVKGRGGRFPRGICYMGVGFGRLSSQQPGGTADKNPLLNIVHINDGRTNSTSIIHQGYVITEMGVWVGLAKSNSKDFSFVKLSPHSGAQSTYPLKEWNGTGSFLDYHDNLNMQGTILFDTGITRSYLSGTAFQNAPRPYCLATGDQYAIKIGHLADTPIETLEMTVGDFDNPITPSQVKAKRRDATFVNTGRFFFRCFDLLLDAEEGWLGLRKHEPCKPSGMSSSL